MVSLYSLLNGWKVLINCTTVPQHPLFRASSGELRESISPVGVENVRHKQIFIKMFYRTILNECFSFNTAVFWAAIFSCETSGKMVSQTTEARYGYIPVGCSKVFAQQETKRGQLFETYSV